MRALSFVLLSLHCSLRAFAAVCAPPIALPITNVQLSNRQSTRGILASVGNPPQNISFMPHSYLNDTWVYNLTAPFCLNGTTSSQCLSQRGGLYDPENSKTSRKNLDVYKAGADPSDTRRTSGTHIWDNSWATDDFAFANVTLHDYPLGLPGFDFGGRFDTQANIGLGHNSSLLNALKAKGLIQSRTYSYWYGIDSATSSASVDGHIVLGGYDAAKVVGDGITQPLLPSSVTCPSGMAINVVQLALNFPNGSNHNLIASNSIAACIQLDFPVVLSVPFSPIYQNFIDSTDSGPWANSLGTYWFTYTYPRDYVYNGDLTVSLQSGFSTRIPNDAFVVPDQMVGPSGAIVYNDTSSAVLIDSLQNINANDEPLVGKVFFSSTYLMVDLDAMTYTMWPVKVTTESDLVAHGGNCSSSTNQTSNPSTSDPQTASTNSQDSKTGTSAGTIAGAVVGSLAGVALVAAGIVYWMRKGRASPPPEPKAEAETLAPAAPQQNYYQPEPVQYYPTYHEVSGEGPKPQELDVARPVQELEGSFAGDQR